MKRLLVFGIFLSLVGTAFAGEGGFFDFPLISMTGPFSGTWNWPNSSMATTLQLSQGVFGPNTLTGDGYLPWDWPGTGGTCYYGRNPTYPCADGKNYPITPPNPPANCPTSYNNTLFLCLDRVPTHYICHVTFSGTFNVFIGTAPPLPQLNAMTAYPQEDYKQPCPNSVRNAAFMLNFTPDGTDCDGGFCNENYTFTGTLGGTSVSGSLDYNGE